jgi:KH domain-containing protein
METIFFENSTADLKKNIKEIEKKLNVKLTVKGKEVSIEGEGITEYESLRVLEAMSSGFSSKVALMLKENDLMFKKISMKDITTRPDLKTVRARVIGKHGQTKHTIEQVSDCYLAVQGNDVSIIASPDNIEEALTAIKNLIRGSKQANVYHFLESMNTSRKSLSEDLGLKSKNEPTKYELKKKKEAEKKLKENQKEA